MKYKLKTKTKNFEFYSDNPIVKNDFVSIEKRLFKIASVIHEVEEKDEVTSIKLLAVELHKGDIMYECNN